MRTISLLLPGILACLAFPVLAETSSDDAQLKQLMQSLQQVKSADGTFVERKYMQMLNQPLESSGTLDYTAPDKVEKNTLLPQPERFTIDGDTLTVERNGDTHTLSLQDYPELAAFVESMRATLGGDIATLNRFYTVSFHGDLDNWQMSLEPKDPKIRDKVKWVGITGSKAVLHKIETLESDGDRSEMTITEKTP